MDSKLPIDSKFIGDVYAVSLKPNNYDELIAGWDQLLSTVVHAQNLSASDLLDDVESKPVTDLTTLEPHFDRSYSALLRIGREPTPLDLIHLDPRPCFGISTSGRVTQINQRAHSLYPKILDENINSLIESDHHLVLTDALTTMSKEDLSGKHVENLEGLASKQSVVANLTLVSPETGETGLFALMPLKAHADNDDTIARLVSVDLSWNETIGSWMKTAFDLSSAEVEVLRTLVSGHTLSELAAEKARSIETIRTQLKSLLRKTKLSSQIELIRLFSGFSLVPPELEAMKADKPTFRSYSNAITLPDGRVMQVDEFGPCSGQPVLFLHGMLDGTEPTTIAKNLLIERNIRMICPWRPGFAGSSPHECETSVAPKAFAEDLKFLATELGLPRCPIVGNMAGSLYAFASASYHPENYSAIVLLAGTIPISSDEQIAMMSTRQRIIAFTSKYAPRLVPFILRAAVAQVDAGGADKLVKAMYQGSPHDAELVKNPEIRRLLFEGYRASMAQGQVGFLSDGLQVLTDWSNYIDAIDTVDMPIHMVHGRHDPTIKMSTVGELCKRYPRIKLTELADLGQLVFYGDPLTVIQVFDECL